jgi:alpha/beta superfamily hydrolase
MALFTEIPDELPRGSFLLDGIAGPIEVTLDPPASNLTTPRSIALCCHPHPLFGGSMTNKVIHTVARSCAAAGAMTLRFNFRGVGRSAGIHDQGDGETLDVEYLAGILRRRWPRLPLWLSGFSFGAWISLKSANTINPDRLISVAPPVGRWDFSRILAPDCPWMIVQGERDELVDCAAVVEWSQRLQASPQLIRLPEADHFFHGQLLELRAVLDHFLTASESELAALRKI